MPYILLRNEFVVCFSYFYLGSISSAKLFSDCVPYANVSTARSSDFVFSFSRKNKSRDFTRIENHKYETETQLKLDQTTVPLVICSAGFIW